MTQFLRARFWLPIRPGMIETHLVAFWGQISGAYNAKISQMIVKL